MINRSLLLQLFDQNEAIVARVLLIFKDQVPVQLAELHAAIAQPDYDAASIVAHNIKSQCQYLGLDQAVMLCQAVENEPDAPAVPAQLAELEAIIAEVLLELD